MESYTKILADEHQLILRAISLMQTEGDKLASGQEINNGFWQKSINFIQNFADKFHHAKEEDLLFKELCQDSVSLHCNPIDQMLHEHDLGRGFVREMISGLSNDDKQRILDNARNYCQLLTEHIFKEDNILYPMSEQALSSETKESLLTKFKEISDNYDKSQLEKYLSFIN